jgi:hypothetical protein
MITDSFRSLSTLVALKIFSDPSLTISSALSAAAFELNSPERENGEDSTTPCGVRGVVSPGSRAQIRLAVEKTECPHFNGQQRKQNPFYQKVVQ